MPNLVELGLEGCSFTKNGNGKANLSQLNNCSKLRCLILNDSAVDFSLIQTTINNLDLVDHESLFFENGGATGWQLSGFIIPGDVSNFDFSNCKSINKFMVSSYYFCLVDGTYVYGRK